MRILLSFCPGKLNVGWTYVAPTIQSEMLLNNSLAILAKRLPCECAGFANTSSSWSCKMLRWSASPLFAFLPHIRYYINAFPITVHVISRFDIGSNLAHLLQSKRTQSMKSNQCLKIYVWPRLHPRTGKGRSRGRNRGRGAKRRHHHETVEMLVYAYRVP